MSYPPSTPPALPNTLGDIIAKIRRITKSPSQNQITDTQIIQYINTYYVYDFPEEIRLKNTFTNWTFVTQPRQESYPLPTDQFLSIEPPLYINGYQSFFTQSQENFYQLYPRLGLTVTLGFGNGTTGPYTFTISDAPVLQNNVVIGTIDSGDNSVYATDVPVPAYVYPPPSSLPIFLGSLQGPGVAPNPSFPALPNQAINYLNGTVIINFNNPIPSGNEITAQIVPYNPSRPVAALFYQDILYLRPIPDDFYQVTVAAYQTPFTTTAVSSPNNIQIQGPNAVGPGFNNSGTTTDATLLPQIRQWWQLIALGAALKIFEDRGDVESMQRFFPSYDLQRRLALRRTLVEMANERTSTIYTDQCNYPQGNFFNQF